MTKKQQNFWIGAGITIVVVYVGYKLITKATNNKLFINTNNKSVFPVSNGSPADVPLNNIGKEAITNKQNVHLRRNAGIYSFLGTGLFDNTDQIIQTAGTDVGKIVSVNADPVNPILSWYGLDKYSTSFLHDGDQLFVSQNDVTIS